MLTKPVAGASASVGFSPGMTQRCPNGSVGLWPRANGADRAIGMSGAVSKRPAGSTMVRLIQGP